MVEDQLTLSCFVGITLGESGFEDEGRTSGIIIQSVPSSDFIKKSCLHFIGTRVFDGEVLVGMISGVHDKILRCCDSLAHRGCMKFNLLDLVIEMESLFPDDKYLETTIAARLRELCQWKLVQREDPNGRKGVYIYNGGPR